MLTRQEIRLECLRLVATKVTDAAEMIAGAKAIELYLDSTDDLDAFKAKLDEARKSGAVIDLAGRVLKLADLAEPKADRA